MSDTSTQTGPSRGTAPTSPHGDGHPPAGRDVGKTILWSLGAVCIVLFFSDLAYHKHAHFEFENSLGFHGLFGFAAYATIVNSAKLLRLWVKRPEDYYND